MEKEDPKAWDLYLHWKFLLITVTTFTTQAPSAQLVHCVHTSKHNYTLLKQILGYSKSLRWLFSECFGETTRKRKTSVLMLKINFLLSNFSHYK